MMAKSDTREQTRIDIVVFMLYLSADDDEKGHLKQAETEGALTLERATGDDDHTELDSTIFNIIATKSPTKKIQLDVEIISDIQTCKRTPSEKAHVFEIRYRTFIARYIFHFTGNHRGDDQKCGVMTLRKAVLTPDNFNAITFQLTTRATTSKRKKYTVTIDAELTKSVASMLPSAAAGDSPHV